MQDSRRDQDVQEQAVFGLLGVHCWNLRDIELGRLQLRRWYSLGNPRTIVEPEGMGLRTPRGSLSIVECAICCTRRLRCFEAGFTGDYVPKPNVRKVVIASNFLLLAASGYKKTFFARHWDLR
jgi:hypothetical protein